MDRDRIAAAMDVPRAEREVLRWGLLVALWHARPYGAEETLLAGAMRDALLRTTQAQVRTELGSLDKRGLVHVRRDGPIWWAELTAAGEDVVEYRAEAPAGIARPAKW